MFLLELWEFEVFIWTQRLSLTSEARDHSGKSCAFDQGTWEIKFHVDIQDCSGVIGVLSFPFGLKDQVWPRRSRVIVAKIAHLIKKLARKKFHVNIFGGSRDIRAESFHFGLRAQVWPWRSKVFLQDLCQFSQVTLPERASCKYLWQSWSYKILRFWFWPQRSSLTSEVKCHFAKKLHIS